MEEKGNVVTKLKKIINANGLGFLGKNPYQTYTELMNLHINGLGIRFGM